MSATILTSDFGNRLENNLTAIFTSTWNKRWGKHQYMQVFEKRKADKDEEKIMQMSGFGRAPNLGEAEPVIMDTSSEGYIYPFKMKKFGLGYSISEEMMDDDQYAKITPHFTKALAKSMKDTKELEAANIFNFGYSTDTINQLPDGQPLFSASHDVPRGGAQSNVLSVPAEFSEVVIEEMKINVELMLDDVGLDADLNYVNLIIHPRLKYDVERVLGSDLQSGTGNNDINAGKAMDGELKVSKMRKLANPDRFYLQTDDMNGAILYQRKKFKSKFYPNYEDDVMNYKVTERYRFGIGSWRFAYANGNV